MNQKIVIDATDSIFGRVAAYAAKQSLLGKSVTIVNCNDALISGQKSTTIEKYKKLRTRKSSTLKGPNFPKHPERLMKRAVRGMLSYTQGRGLAAFKRVICYNETPAEFESVEKISLKRPIKTRTIKLGELSKRL